MKRRRLIWKLYPSFVFISLTALISVTLIACLSFRSFYYQQKESELSSKANLVRTQFLELIKNEHYDKIQEICERSGKSASTRLTVMLTSGQVIGDSEKDPSDMDNHLDRPEIRTALGTKHQGVATRYSHTLKEDLMYLAVPLFSENQIVGLVRVSIPLIGIQSALWSIYYRILIGLFVLLFFVAGLSWFVSRKLSRPLEMMKVQAEKIAEGDLSRKINLHPSEPQEAFDLANAMNKISVQLKQKMDEILASKNEQEAVYSSILEGIIALNREGKIVHLNKAAHHILGIDKISAKTINNEDTIRNAELQGFMKTALQKNEPFENDIVIQNGETRYLYVYSSPMMDTKGHQIGVVVVINDLTKLRELENHRREFVANVSHELKTPLTSIQGFSETLLNPSVTDPNERKEFLKIIHNHASRLGAIIEDLLSLSKIEKESTQKEIALTDEWIKPTLESAMELCQTKADQRNTRFRLRCPDDIRARINRPLFEQAMVNLFDNAIKYGKVGGEIQIEVETTPSAVCISVADQGVGISKEHLPRLFERFYRVDKARSRTMGGTGLGLSIVKHIALAHQGSVDVQSTIGKGSQFSFTIPISSS
ncbi:MAG: ATP-binding protein [Nitrospiria bacterium]